MPSHFMTGGLNFLNMANTVFGELTLTQDEALEHLQWLRKAVDHTPDGGLIYIPPELRAGQPVTVFKHEENLFSL
jgi:hypothetical protein